MSTKVTCLAMVCLLVVGLILLASLHKPLAALANRQPQQTPSQSDAPASDAGVLAGDPYAFVNQPWDWVEGYANPGETVHATLRRHGELYAAAQTVAESDGSFAIQLLRGGEQVDILVGDIVEVSGGGLDETITVVDIAGVIDSDSDTVRGQVSGGSFPAQGIANVGFAWDRGLATKPITIDAGGLFTAGFGSSVDIGTDHLAKAVYEDPESNQIVQVLYPEGLDIRVLVTEGIVEGVAAPDTAITITVSHGSEVKGTAVTTTDKTGFFSTAVYDDHGIKARLELGDHVTVDKTGRSREMDVSLHHISHIQPWNDRVVGTVKGVTLPSEGTQGRVDLWDAADDQWHTQYVGIGPDGTYSADFSGIVEMTPNAIVRVWVTEPEGIQQAALGWALDIGASTSDDVVWGYGTVSSTAYITLYHGVEDSVPVDVIGTATTVVNKMGYFSTTVESNGFTVDIQPYQGLVVQAGEYVETLLISSVRAEADVGNNTLTMFGPPGAIVHIEARRAGVAREDAPYQADYAWRGATIGSNGTVTVDLSPFDVRPGDWFDITYYGAEDGVAVHSLVVSGEKIYLPAVLRNVQ